MDAYKRYSELFAQGRYEEALPFAERALKLAEQEFGPNDPSTAVDLNNLAVAPLWHRPPEPRKRKAPAEAGAVSIAC